MINKLFLIIFGIFYSIFVFAQDPIYDTIITNLAYTSYFHKIYHNPIIVTYTLYQGGGNCSRNKCHFNNDIKSLNTSTNKDYLHSGYDKGHLANSEDFANNCKLDELTFRFYNCIPQTVELNRGLWKKLETEIRKKSQLDSLFIICYNTYSSKKIKNIYIPDTCYKFVYNLRTHKMIFATKFSNNHQPIQINISENEIYQKFNWIFTIK